MSSGLRALMEKANETKSALPFRINLYTGSVFVSGSVAPYWWMQDRSVDIAVAQAERQLRRRKERYQGEREALAKEAVEPVAKVLNEVRGSDSAEADEVTLLDAVAFPAVGNESSGGVRLPVVRVPLSSVSAWWIVDDGVIEGRHTSSFGMGLGVLLPLGN